MIDRRTFLRRLAGAPLASAMGPFAGGGPGVSAQEAQGRLNILVVVFDTLSATNMSLYGYPRRTTPQIERFAERAAVYHAHYAGGSFTPSGTATLLTGTNAWTHRAMHHAGTVLPELAPHNLFACLPRHHRIAYTHNLFAELQFSQFREHIDRHIDPAAFSLTDGVVYDWLSRDDVAAYHGIEDLALQSYDSSSLHFMFLELAVRKLREWIINRRNQAEFPRGLPDHYRMLCRLEDATAGVMSTIEACPRPYLFYVHLLPPHAPYNPAARFIGRFDRGWNPAPKPRHPLSQDYAQAELDELRRHYDESVAYVDAEFGRLIDRLEASGAMADTCVVLTSDHGEMFERATYEHESPHLFDAVVKIPLLIRWPGLTRRHDVGAFTSATDVLPTLLHLAGEPIPAWCEGRVLPPATEAGGSRPVFALDARRTPKRGPLTQGTAAMLEDRMKLIYYHAYPRYDDVVELYDLDADPDEVVDLAATRTERAMAMKADILARLEQAGLPVVGVRSA